MADVCIGMVQSGGQAIGRDAIECILGQNEVDLEVWLVVLDEDQSFPLPSDPRVKVLRHSRLPSAVQILELMANQSTAPLLMCLEPNQHLLPNALATFLADMQKDESIEMTCTLQFSADETGQVSRAAYHRQWEQAHTLRGIDATRVQSFLAVEFLPGNVRIYRRLALCSKVFGASKDYSMYGFIWSVHCFLASRLKSEPLCISKGMLPDVASRRASTRDGMRRVIELLKYRTRLKAEFGWSEVLSTALWNFCLNSPAADAWKRSEAITRHWRTRSGLSAGCYRFLVWVFSRWPIPRPKVTRTATASSGKRIGYYIWQYPVRSQTFVQREVSALLAAGQDVVVISEIAPEHDFISELKPRLAGAVINSGERAKLSHKSQQWSMFRRTPLRYLGLRLFVLGTRYHAKKNRRFDKEVFKTALRLASIAEEQGATHLHAPWADNCAFVALIAARLLGLPFSVQARAHDIHRQNYRFGLKEKFLNADFIVTNTHYNVDQIRSIVGEAHAGNIKLIYNGLNIRQFQPNRASRKESDGKSTGEGDEARLLCVARLVRQKGLIYLLHACRRLVDAGMKIRCDIVGGYVDLFMNDYIELKRLQRALKLENIVVFAGSLPFEAVLAYYQNADIFVLPCVITEDGSRDITPNAVLEAMAMQLPVVSTKVTGLPELVEDGQSGFLVPPHDVEALVAAIAKLVQSPGLRTEFGLMGRKKVEQQFDSDINVARYRELFDNPGNSQPQQGSDIA